MVGGNGTEGLRVLFRNTIGGAKRPALAYLRTPSSTNFGKQKDSGKEQWAAIQAYAKRAGYVIVLPPYNDSAVSDADPLDTRPSFAQMFAYLMNHAEVRTILVESAQCFSRDLIVQETGFRMLKGRGIDLVAVDAPDSFTADTPTAVMVQQILGAVHQFQRTVLISQLRAARDRKGATDSKCGRLNHTERHADTVRLARSLRWINKRLRQKRSLRDISLELARQGHLAASGKPYALSTVRAMLA